MEKSINKRLDIAAIRAAQKNVVSIPSWVESGKLAYSRQHQCHVRVLDCLGELANVEIKGKIQQIPIIELEEASFSSTTIDNSSISHSVFKAFASDFIDQIQSVKVLPGKVAERLAHPESLHPYIKAALHKNGIEQFYSHQAQAFEELASRCSLTLVTPTASGKTLAFMPWIFHASLTQKATSLLIYPLRALAADQYAKLMNLNEALPPESRLKLARCTGDIPIEKRKKYFLGTHCPDIIVASPDVLHHLLYHTRNPNMQLWQEFLFNLKCCVIDEAHTYTSSFGIHFANLLRRVRLAITNVGGNSLDLSWVGNCDNCQPTRICFNVYRIARKRD